eukprot:CAMPEP_0116886654 /NCGR_PEP_ID=MMETSP0463-20121206/20593_1 /TAXON_ID=181622 /ORGANISM="Strombidinopsis sp, Strain SopsisLIS2011" /LENGTH=177 /DNA_ID=CAMNT_0004547469 /DNA_START=254 /DNA_END=787 /DNA_ORIENTATION=-
MEKKGSKLQQMEAAVVKDDAVTSKDSVITASKTTSHSEMQTRFSDNSSEAETHLLTLWTTTMIFSTMDLVILDPSETWVACKCSRVINKSAELIHLATWDSDSAATLVLLMTMMMALVTLVAWEIWATWVAFSRSRLAPLVEWVAELQVLLKLKLTSKMENKSLELKKPQLIKMDKR